MKKLIIILSINTFLYTIGINEIQAACYDGDFSCNGSSGTSAYCCYKITGTDINGRKSIEIYKDPATPEGVKSRVGTGAFWGNRTISSVDIKDVEIVGLNSFVALPNLTKVNMPNVESIGGSAFNFSTNLIYIGLPTNIPTSVGYYHDAYPFTAVPAMNNCVSDAGFRHCGTCDDYIKTGTGCVKNCGSGYLGKEGKCILASQGCGDNYRQIEDFCNRVRYTPVEAAAIASDNNINVVTLTFKE